MKITTRKKPAASNQLPSRFQIGDRVQVQDRVGQIEAVLFFKSKVNYHVRFPMIGVIGPIDSVNVGPVTCGNSKAPPGWTCSRDKGHEGPCAAHLDLKGDSKPIQKVMIPMITDLGAEITKTGQAMTRELSAKFAEMCRDVSVPKRDSPKSSIHAILDELRVKSAQASLAKVRDTNLCKEITHPYKKDPE